IAGYREGPRRNGRGKQIGDRAAPAEVPGHLEPVGCPDPAAAVDRAGQIAEGSETESVVGRAAPGQVLEGFELRSRDLARVEAGNVPANIGLFVVLGAGTLQQVRRAAAALDDVD